MSLEQLLKENTEATLAQNELLAKLLENSGGAATGSTTSSTSSTESSDDEPKRERGKPSAGKSKRTAAEIAEDKAADEADAAAAGSDDGDGSDAGPTFDSVKEKLATWLGEFAKEADKEKPEGTHPEVLARKAALKAVLNKLTGTEDGKLGAISADSDKIAKLDNWFEEKALKADKGHGVGRLAPDPEETEESSDDDLDI